jgi:hypothetical protein
MLLLSLVSISPNYPTNFVTDGRVQWSSLCESLSVQYSYWSHRYLVHAIKRDFVGVLVSFLMPEVNSASGRIK